MLNKLLFAFRGHGKDNRNAAFYTSAERMEDQHPVYLDLKSCVLYQPDYGVPRLTLRPESLIHDGGGTVQASRRTEHY